jgi:ATP-binding cassette subfamily B multidrug efflux pump
MMAHLIDALSQTPPAELWARHEGMLTLFAVVLAGSVVAAAAYGLLKYQGLFINFPMRLRWTFHRQLLEQSMAFYQDEFAGRIATKVMQTALAVRDTWMTFSDILVYVGVYFVTLLGVLGVYDIWLVAPFVVWIAAYAVTLRWFVPRLAAVGQAQADARSLMTGRVTDAYANIATVKLFSHARREAHFARQAMQSSPRPDTRRCASSPRSKR